MLRAYNATYDDDDDAYVQPNIIIINEGSLCIMHNDIKSKYIDTTTRSAAS